MIQLIMTWEEREKVEDAVETSINEKEIPVSFIKSKSVKMTFQVLPLHKYIMHSVFLVLLLS